MGYGTLVDGRDNVAEKEACEETPVPKETLGDIERVTVITVVSEMVDPVPDVTPVAPIALEVELRGYGGDEKLDTAPDDSPEEYGDVPVGMIEEWVLDLDLL